MENILEIQNLLKIYPDGTIANRDININVKTNSIHAVVGENGAGKSTLMKMIFGSSKPTDGKILFKGSETSFKSPNDAIRAGIGMVHQHLMLAPDLTVAENMLLGIEPRKHRFFLDSAGMIKTSREISERYGLNVPADKKVSELPIGIRQRVEILKALLRNAEVLILDEPTAVLTPQEVEVLFKTLHKLKEDGKTILFISHKLSEVMSLSDTITVMRDTRVVTTEDTSALSQLDVSRLMVGRDIKTDRIKSPVSPGEKVLSISRLSFTDENGKSALNDVSFDIRRGEIVGIAGVEGNGQSELSRIISGLLPAASGSVKLDGKELLGLTSREIRESGVCHIPEDRMENGIAPSVSVKENLISDRYFKPGFSGRMLISGKAVSEQALDFIKRFNILTQSENTPVGSLSGGNIQKVVVARELTSGFSLVLAAQPTRGVDVGSEEMIHDLLRSARDEGNAILLISADLDEVLKLSDRILVIYEGRITAHFTDPAAITDRDLGPYMLGVKKEDGADGKIHS